MKPNLFSYATSELSNDAILCWMLEWGNYKNSSLYGLSRDLILKFTGVTSSVLEIDSIKISRQYKNIDILVNVNDEYLIVIEDKIDTTEHSNQLQRYRDIIKEDYKEKIAEDKIFFIYLTIGDESSYKSIEDQGYNIITRVDILKVLECYKGVGNDILNNYYEHLFKIEKEVNLYKQENCLSKWKWRTWQGFYMKLQKDKKNQDVGWSYVNNPRGGFWAFWWNINRHYYKDGIIYNQYLQIEENRITFKVGVVDKKYQSMIRDYVWGKLDEILNKIDITEYRPEKTIFRKGSWMTIAEINSLKTKEDIEVAMEIAEEINEQLNEVLEKIYENENISF